MRNNFFMEKTKKITKGIDKIYGGGGYNENVYNIFVIK